MSESSVENHIARGSDISNILLTIILLLGGISSYLFQGTMETIGDDVSFMRTDINDMKVFNRGIITRVTRTESDVMLLRQEVAELRKIQ